MQYAIYNMNAMQYECYACSIKTFPYSNRLLNWLVENRIDLRESKITQYTHDIHIHDIHVPSISILDMETS
jgi:hypothetical protein